MRISVLRALREEIAERKANLWWYVSRGTMSEKEAIWRLEDACRTAAARAKASDEWRRLLPEEPEIVEPAEEEPEPVPLLWREPLDIRVEDRVLLSELGRRVHKENNENPGCVGTVMKIAHGMLSVRWDNGYTGHYNDACMLVLEGILAQPIPDELHSPDMVGIQNHAMNCSRWLGGACDCAVIEQVELRGEIRRLREEAAHWELNYRIISNRNRPEMSIMGKRMLEVCVPAAWDEKMVVFWATRERPPGSGACWRIVGNGDEWLRGKQQRAECLGREGFVHIRMALAPK